MNQQYEQLNVESGDTFSTPFNRTKKRLSNLSGIVQSKGRFTKLIFIFGVGVSIIILCILLASKSSQLSTVRQSNSELNDQLSQINQQLQELNQQMTQINNEKSNLAKQNNDLTSSIEELEGKNKKQQEENDVTQLSINDVKGKMLSTNQMLSKLTDENSKTELESSQLEINSKTYTTEIDNLQKN